MLPSSSNEVVSDEFHAILPDPATSSEFDTVKLHQAPVSSSDIEADPEEDEVDSEEIIPPFTRTTVPSKVFWFMTRWPSVCMLISMLPSIIAIFLLCFPHWTLQLDLTYGQFTLDGDTDGRNQNAWLAASTVSYNKATPIVSANAQAHPKLNVKVSATFRSILTPSAAAKTPLESDQFLSQEDYARRRHQWETFWKQSIGHHSNSSFSFVYPPSESESVITVDELSDADLIELLETQSQLGDAVTRTFAAETLMVLYTSSDGSNILTNEHIATIYDIERNLRASDGFTRYCRLNSGSNSGQCSMPNTIINFLYPTVSGGQIIFDGKGNQVDVPPAVVLMLQNNRDGFFSRSTSLSNPTSDSLISTFQFGVPLDGYSLADSVGRQRSEIRTWMATLEPLFQKVDGKNGLRVLREGGDLFAVEIQNTLKRDAVTVVISIVVIVLYMWFHCRSFFLTAAAITHMAFSFPPILLWYRYQFGNLFQIMNVVSLWLILGIGADDVFVFVDTWAQYEKAALKSKNPDLLAHQLSWTWRKSCSAMLVTSLTTAAGFYSTAISRLLPLREFGFFLGGVVVVNYLFMITWFPACVVLHQKYAPHCCRRLRGCFLGRMLGMEKYQREAEYGDAIHKRNEKEAKRRKIKVEIEMDQISNERHDVANPVTVAVPAASGKKPLPHDVNAKENRYGFDPNASAAAQSLLSGSSSSPPVPSESPDSISDSVSPLAPSSSSRPLVHEEESDESVREDDNLSPPVPRSSCCSCTAESIMIAFHRHLYRFRWLVVVFTLAFVVALAVQIPRLRPPSDLPQLLPSDSNIEMLRATKKNLQCDTCWLGLPDASSSTTPTCPISVCGDPNELKKCEGIVCNNGGQCRSGFCECPSAWYGDRCQYVNSCNQVDCHQGNCMVLGNSYQCRCFSGWTGSDCTIPIPVPPTPSSTAGPARVSSSTAAPAKPSSSSSSSSGGGRSSTGSYISSSTSSPAVLPTASQASSTGSSQPSSTGGTPVVSSSSTAVAPSSSSSTAIPVIPSSTAVIPSSTAAPVIPSSTAAPPVQLSSSTSLPVVSSSSSGSSAGTPIVSSSSGSTGISPVAPSSTSPIPSSISSSSTGTGGTVSSSTGGPAPMLSSTGSQPPVVLSSSSTGGGGGKLSSTAVSSTATKPAVVSSSSSSSTAAPRPSSASTASPVVSSSSSSSSTASSSSSSTSVSSTGPSSGDASSSSTGGGTPTPPPPPPPPPPKPISADLSLRLDFVWGVSNVDMSAADSDNKGVPIFDPAFDLNQPISLAYLTNSCINLMNRTDIRTDSTDHSRCIMIAFRNWVINSGYNFPPVPGQGVSATWLMLNFLRVNHYQYGDDVGFVAKGYGANENIEPHSIAHSATSLSSRDGSFRTPPHLKHSDINFASADSYRISFVRATALTYIDREQGGLQLKPSYDDWQSWMDNINAYAPSSLGEGFQASSQWSRMRVELAFISGTIKSIAISVVTVAMTILLFTHNVWLMLYTVLCILLIVVCLLGLFVIWGFSLGAMEAISVPLVVGLSVDYCLHLGHAYNHAGEVDKGDPKHRPIRDRSGRMRSALISIGPSVVSAAVTTVGSMLVLIFCQLHPFREIGIIVSSTLVLGIYFSMCVFGVLCLLWGPEDQQGNILVWIKNCKKRCTKYNRHTAVSDDDASNSQGSKVSHSSQLVEDDAVYFHSKLEG